MKTLYVLVPQTNNYNLNETRKKIQN
jgi:hypothetical protein